MVAVPAYGGRVGLNHANGLGRSGRCQLIPSTGPSARCHAGEVRALLEATLGPVEHMEAVTRGYTHNDRMMVTLSDGRSVFAKGAVDEVTAGWLRREHQMYETLRNELFVPQLVAWVDHHLPILVLEDLCDAIWPPPWDRAKVAAVLSILDDLAQCHAPEGLPRLVNGEQPDEGWHRVLAGNHSPCQAA